MSILSNTKRMFRGEVSARTATLETIRRAKALWTRRQERGQLSELNGQPALLREEFARIRASDLLAHFRSRVQPKFFPGIGDPQATARLQQELLPEETSQLITQADRIAGDHCWTLLGIGEKCFGTEEVNWHLDPLSGFAWPHSYHADINLFRTDGSDVRIVWELNRLAHLVTLGRAYGLTNDEKLSAEFFRQLASWRRQNPVGLGVNWNCAMEVALRAMNLLAAFVLFLRAPQMNGEALKDLLRMFDQHGAAIHRNLEFSHIATSNHYLADVTGLLWLGVMLPELQAAREWREFGLRELLNEMEKQVLPDGADYEASTGYHRLTLELFLYSFVLCHLNGIDIDETHWKKLGGMIEYVRAYLRPDGGAPLIGDSDSGQVLPIVRRAGNDHGYILALGAAVFQEPRFKLAPTLPPEELFWILGEQGFRDYEALPNGEPARSQAFPHAGTYVLREDDLYLLFNASGSGVNGRGSHGHNDALSIEVSACGTAFIIDPGTYVYTHNLAERHMFRSTAYHSTVQVDGQEQNTIDEAVPFIIGNEARPHAFSWESNEDEDTIVAEHYGYRRLPQPITHRRRVRFDKRKRFWIIDDELSGEGPHEFTFRFHLAPGIEANTLHEGAVALCDKMSGAKLLIADLLEGGPPELESSFASTDYGAKQPSTIVLWSERATVPALKRWAIIPLRANEDDAQAIELVAKLRAENSVSQL